MTHYSPITEIATNLAEFVLAISILPVCRPKGDTCWSLDELRQA